MEYPKDGVTALLTDKQIKVTDRLTQYRIHLPPKTDRQNRQAESHTQQTDRRTNQKAD